MSDLNSSNQIIFCIHLKFKMNLFERILLNISLKKSRNINFEVQTDDSCLGTYCLYLFAPVFFTTFFFEKLLKVFENKEIKIAYSDFQIFNFSLLGFWSNQLLPAWSPKRFWQTNYLGPVIAVNSETLGIKEYLAYQELAETVLKNNVLKLSGIGYRVMTKIYQPEIEVHFNAISSFLKTAIPKYSANLNLENHIEISFKSLAPKLISVIVPTRGTKNSKNGEVLVNNLARSLNRQIRNESKIELVVVYDDDVDVEYLSELIEATPNLNTKLVRYSPPFNFSTKSNLGAENSIGEVLIFLNDDTEFISEDAILELAGTAMLNDVGAVGAKLYFENGAIQHAGTIVLGGNLGHAYFKQSNPIGVLGDLVSLHEVSAVTGACLAQRKDIWEELNGWDQVFDNSYNDVDYCFRIREAGYSILQNNQIELYHFESLTRDATFSPKAKELIEKRWKKYLVDDQFFPQYVENQKKRQKFRSMIKRIVNKVRKIL